MPFEKQEKKEESFGLTILQDMINKRSGSNFSRYSLSFSKNKSEYRFIAGTLFIALHAFFKFFNSSNLDLGVFLEI